MPLHIIDTAGLRDANDEVELSGIEHAGRRLPGRWVLFMVDCTTTGALTRRNLASFIERLPLNCRFRHAQSTPMSPASLGISEVNGHSLIRLSARTGDGVEVRRNHLSRAWASIPIWKASPAAVTCRPWKRRRTSQQGKAQLLAPGRRCWRRAAPRAAGAERIASHLTMPGPAPSALHGNNRQSNVAADPY